MIEKPPDVEPSKPVADGKPNGNGSRNVILEVQPRVELPRGGPRDAPRRPLGLVIIGVISVIAILAIVPSWIQKWLWMRQVGYSRRLLDTLLRALGAVWRGFRCRTFIPMDQSSLCGEERFHLPC